MSKLSKVSLKSPIRIEASSKYQTVTTLDQYYVFIPSKTKDCYLSAILYKNLKKKAIIFVRTRLGALRVGMILKDMKFSSEWLHGEMSQTQRQKSL